MIRNIQKMKRASLRVFQQLHIVLKQPTAVQVQAVLHIRQKVPPGVYPDHEDNFSWTAPKRPLYQLKHLFEDLGIPAGTKGRIKASSYPGGVRPKTDDRPAGRGGSGHRNGGGNRPRSDAAPKREGGHTKPAHGDGEHKRPTTERTAGDRQRRRTRGGTQ